MKIGKRRTWMFLFGVLAVMLCGLWTSRDVQAASAVVSGHTDGLGCIGKYWFKVNNYSGSGKSKLYISTSSEKRGTMLVQSASKESIGDTVFTDGTYVYYTLTKKGAKKTHIYRVNIKSKAKKWLLSYPASYGRLLAYRWNRIVVGKQYKKTQMKMWAYDTKKKTRTSLQAVSSAMRQYGNYLMYSKSTQKGSDFVHAGLYVYNLYAGGKPIFISKRGQNATVVGGKLYYSEDEKISAGTWRFTIKRCSLNGQSKETLGSKNMKCDEGFGTGGRISFYSKYALYHFYYRNCQEFNYAERKWKNLSYEDYMNRVSSEKVFPYDLDLLSLY